MSRIYDTTRQDAAERAAAAELAKHWGCKVARFPRFCPVDYFAHKDGELRALIEVKCRTHRIAEYPTLILDAHKWLTVTQAALGFRVWPVLLVQFADALAFADLSRTPIDHVSMGGRSDRGDTLDSDLVVHLAVASFRRIVVP